MGAAETTVPAPPGRSWNLTTSDGDTATGYLPGWAEEDPSRTDVPPGALRAAVYDVIHRAPFDGQLIRFAKGGYGQGESFWVLAGNIECIPEADADQPSDPVVNIHLIEDFWLSGLGPEELATFAAKLRAQADLLDRDIRPQLIACRADWAARHGASDG
ncbi:DUF6907 domain-containing protein [Actinacidiphila bryophytorum]|uniref:DUF6907 domain-containing protein n=1 Tax=Actinacidiphila bryophytorum TaxID=1436133 RepID=UPI002176C8FD|nr:hypothetical protein [Actinacidiphila bryophytorum]UWE10823.1 hypothetical protein NYE86_20315 [Actinacidiphila bryophytorum]